MPNFDKILGKPYYSALLRLENHLPKNRQNPPVLQFSAIDVPLDPKQKFFLTLDISTFNFNKYARFRYGKLRGGDECSSEWWIDGMQRDVVDTIHIICDDLDGDIFLLYCAQNCEYYPQILGTLVESEFATECHKRLASLLQV